MNSNRAKSQEDTHFRVLSILQDNSEMTQRELAAQVGVSVGAMHYILSALVEVGAIKLGNFTAARDKRRYAYLLTPAGLAQKTAITRRFLNRKLVEYEALKLEIDKLEAEVSHGAAAIGEKC